MVLRCRCHVQRRFYMLKDSFQLGTAFRERFVAQIALLNLQKIEEDYRRGRLRRQCPHPRGRRMDAQSQSVKVQAAFSRNYNLTIEHAMLRQLFQERHTKFRKITVQRFAIAALYQQFILAAKDYRAESVPLRLKTPQIRIRRNLIYPLGEHRQDRRWQW